MNVTSTAWPLPRFTAERLEQLRADASASERDPFLALLAQAKLLAAEGKIADAHAVLQHTEQLYPATNSDLGTFSQLLVSAILAAGAHLARAWLTARFATAYALDIEAAASDAPVEVVRLIVRANAATFVFGASLFQSAPCEAILDRWVDVFPLCHAFMNSPYRVDGSVDISLGDGGLRPGLTFCDFRPGSFLIPDALYMHSSRYKGIREAYRDNDIAWAERQPICFWRGSSSGHLADPAVGWRSLPRFRLCEIARAHSDLIDAGITDISTSGQFDAAAARAWLESGDMMRERVSPRSFQNYRYHIDIDGNSNSWPGLFIKLLTGSPVLKVASPKGYRQWYYDRLRPWINYVPVDTSMQDLVEKIIWLRDNDEVARRIGQAGRELADRLSDAQEIAQAAPVFAAAIRTAAKAPMMTLRFGAGARDNHALQSGWHEPGARGVTASGFESRVELAKPFGIGDYILIIEAAPAVRAPQRVTVIANGHLLVRQSIVERTMIYCALPQSVAAADQKLNLIFCFPDSAANASQDHPLDPRLFSITLLGIRLVSAHCYSGDEHPGIVGALEQLSAGRMGSAIHDLWSPGGATGAAKPPQVVHTIHRTVLFADLATGRVRHGPAGTVPRNLFLMREHGMASLVRVDRYGHHYNVQLRPEGPGAAAAMPSALSTNGFVRIFEVIGDETAERPTFCLRGSGLYVCAEIDGSVTLSRNEPGGWEMFTVRPNETEAETSPDPGNAVALTVPVAPD